MHDNTQEDGVVLKGLFVLALALGLRGFLVAYSAGRRTTDKRPWDPAAVLRPVEVAARRQAAQDDTIAALSSPRAKQILLGDVHEYTTFSFDS